MGFVKDLKAGKSAEILFAKYLMDFPKLTSLELAQGKNKDWDIKITTTEKEITYEIKMDIASEETGNIAIEAKFKGEASGVYRSKADYIVYMVGGKFYIQERGELILRLNSIEKREVKGGDGWNSLLYLIKVDDILQLFEEIPGQ